jgi:hypothetical protein
MILSTKNERDKTLQKRDIPLHSVTKRDITFDFINLKWKGIDRTELEAWKKLYPNADIAQEIRAMIRWLDRMVISREPLRVNVKAKKQNWRKFITNWLNRADQEGIGL